MNKKLKRLLWPGLWAYFVIMAGFVAAAVLTKNYMLAVGEEYGASWCCAGAITKKGHPHHPLYLRKDEKIRPFDVAAYLESLG